MKESKFEGDAVRHGPPLLEQLFRSNFLPLMLKLLRTLRIHHPELTDVLIVSIIIDANKINSELRWRLGKRQKPSALSPMLEAIKSGVLVPIAPPQLEDEILEHAPEIAFDTGSSLEDVLREWEAIKPLIKFHPPSMQQIDVIRLADAEDLIYMATQQQLGLPAVYTDDTHFRQMGAPTVRRSIDRDLRDYARGTAVTVGVSIGSGFAVTIAIEVIPTLFRLLKWGMNWFARQPLFLQLTIVTLVFAIVRHPKVRARLASFCEAHGPAMQELAMQLLLEYSESALKAQTARDRLAEAIPASQKRRTALMHIRAACVVSGTPMGTTAIYRNMYAGGYRSKSSDAVPYLRKVLRACGDFEEVTPDHWVQKSPQRPFDASCTDVYRIQKPRAR